MRTLKDQQDALEQAKSERNREAKRNGIFLWGGLASLLLVAGIIASSFESHREHYSEQLNEAVEYNDTVIMACTYELVNNMKTTFIIEDRNRQPCEDGTITIWKYALTVKYMPTVEELAWETAKAEHPSLTEDQRDEFILRMRRKIATARQQEMSQ